MSNPTLKEMSQEQILDLLKEAHINTTNYIDEVKDAVNSGKPISEISTALEQISNFMINQSTIIDFLRGEPTRCARIWCGCGAKEEYCGTYQSNE